MLKRLSQWSRNSENSNETMKTSLPVVSNPRNKRLFSGFVLGVVLSAFLGALAAPPGVLRTNVSLSWIPPTNQPPSTNYVIKIYSSTNVAIPLTSWPLLTTVSGTNTTVTLPITPPQRFYVATASNWWGESDFSNVAQTPPVLSDEVTLSIGP